MVFLKARDLDISVCLVGEIRCFVEENHYSKNINGVKVTQCFKVTADDCLVGAVLFGQMSTTAWKKFGSTEKSVLELRRLVLTDECGKNSESRVIGWCLRWIASYLPHVSTIVSYADPMYGHSGIIYKASNFTLIGKTPDDKGYRDPTTGKVYHSRAMRTKYKGEYKPFVKRLRKKLENDELETIILKGKHCYVYKLHNRNKIESAK